MVSLQVPTLAYVSECEPEVQTVYESLICNEFLEVRRNASLHRPDQHETAHLSCCWGPARPLACLRMACAVGPFLGL